MLLSIDYSAATIFLSACSDRLVIWNPRKSPGSLKVHLLKEKHSSKPRNRLIADVCFIGRLY